MYITKTGGNSVAEAWALSKNTLFDPPGIAGEVHNVEISEEMGFGKMIRPEDDLGAVVTEIFAKKDAELTLAQKRVRHYFQNFAKNILTEVHHVLS